MWYDYIKITRRLTNASQTEQPTGQEVMTMTPIYQVSHWTQNQQTKIQLRVKWLGVDIFFGSKDGKNYAIIAKYKRRGPSRSGGRWHGNSGIYDVLYRTNFASREAGNTAYRRTRQLFDAFRPWYGGSTEIDCYGDVSIEQIIDALNVR